MQIIIIVIRYTYTCKVEHASIALVYLNMWYEAHIYTCSIEYISYKVHLEAYTCHLKLIYYTCNRTYILFDAHTQVHAWKLIS